MKNRYILLLAGAAALLAGCAHQQTAEPANPSLKFTGRMGQSQPAGQKPFTSIEARGVVELPDGTPAMLMEDTLYRLNPDGSVTAICPMTGGNPVCDGKHIYTFAQFVNKYEQKNGKWISVWKGKRIVPHRNALTVARVGDQGFGQKGKFFNIDWKTRQIFAYDENLNPKGCILTLPEIPEHAQGGRYSAIGLLPGSGDLVVSGYYPSTNTYRYKVDGTQVTKDGWPLRGSWPKIMTPLKEGIAGLGFSAVVMKNSVLRWNDLTLVGDGMDEYIMSMVPDGNGGWYLSSSTGVKHYPADTPRRAETRTGGPGNVVSFAVNGHDIVVSANTLLYRMKLDDAEDSPFSSYGSETWRMNGSWSDSAALLQPDGTGFLVLNKKRTRLFQFEPSIRGKGRWTRLPQEYKNVTAFAVSNGTAAVADNGEYCGLKDIRSMTASGEIVIASTPTLIAAFRNQKQLWTVPLPDISSLTVLQNRYLAAADGTSVILLDLVSGKEVYRTPCCTRMLSASGKWLVVFDNKAKVFYRYKLVF